MARQADDFDEFVLASSPSLVRAAWAITGNRSTAEDLVQASLLHVWQRWNRIRDHSAAEAYARRVLMTTFLGWTRRRWRSEQLLAVLPDTSAHSAVLTDPAMRNDVLAALRELPARQRAVIALRYLIDLTEAQTADALGCSVGAVKSQSAKAIQSLRRSAHLRVEFDGGATDERR